MHTKTSWSLSMRFATLLMTVVYPALGFVDLRVTVRDTAVFRDYFWLDGDFGGMLSDYISLRNGEYVIEVFGPSSGMFYTYEARVTVRNDRVKVKSSKFDTYCADDGMRQVVSKWPTAQIERDDRFAGAFTLVIHSPVLQRRTEPCEPLLPPSMATWKNAGVMALAVNSEPAGADVIVDGRFAAKAGQAVKIPYDRSRQNIRVVVRATGLIGCHYDFSPPFQKAATITCKLRVPGTH